jgi:hypothetical protein
VRLPPVFLLLIVLPPLTTASAAEIGDGGAERSVRLRAAVVVASNEGRDVSRSLQPLERRLRTLLPYTSYRGFTDYTAAVEPGTTLELRLPDGRKAHLRPEAELGRSGAESSSALSARTIHVTIEGGEEFESRVACNSATVFQVRNGTADHLNDRTFLVYSETCPGEHPPRLLTPEK